MVVWSKRVSARLEEQWRARLAWLPDEKVVVSANPAAPSVVRLQVFDVTPAEAEQLEAAFGGQVRELRQDAWFNADQGSQKPLRVKDALLVTNSEAAWKRAQAEFPDRPSILVPPGMAFGTGEHATTLTALRRLAETAATFRRRKNKAWRCCDAGCGTGVLSIAAEKLGAESVDAFDFDPTAVEVTQENLAVNGCKRVRVWQQNVLEWQPPAPGYDVLLANIYGDVLVQAMPILKQALAPTGMLIVSGILRSQAPAVWNAARDNGLQVPIVRRVGKWVTGVLHHA